MGNGPGMGNTGIERLARRSAFAWLNIIDTKDEKRKRERKLFGRGNARPFIAHSSHVPCIELIPVGDEASEVSEGEAMIGLLVEIKSMRRRALSY